MELSNYIMRDPANAWMLGGALLIAFEAFTAPGLGLFLGGLGAISTALAIKAGILAPDFFGAQLACCFAGTVLWTLALWRPLRKFRVMVRTRSGGMKNNNLLGQLAVVSKTGLRAGEVGQVLWSGTTMNAELDASAAPLPEGAQVRIHAVVGNTLKVTPK